MAPDLEQGRSVDIPKLSGCERHHLKANANNALRREGKNRKKNVVVELPIPNRQW
jgi:hypothetical protein